MLLSLKRPVSTVLLRKIQRVLVAFTAIALAYSFVRPALGIVALDRAQAFLTYGDYNNYERLINLALSIDPGPEEMRDLGTYAALSGNAPATDAQRFETYLAAHPNSAELQWDEALIRIRHHDLEGSCNALRYTAPLHNKTVDIMAENVGKKLGHPCR